MHSNSDKPILRHQGASSPSQTSKLIKKTPKTGAPSSNPFTSTPRGQSRRVSSSIHSLPQQISQQRAFSSTNTLNSSRNDTTQPTLLHLRLNDINLTLPPSLQEISYNTHHPQQYLVSMAPPVPFPPQALKVIHVFRDVIERKCPRGTEIRIAGGWIRDLLRCNQEYSRDHSTKIAQHLFQNPPESRFHVQVPVLPQSSILSTETNLASTDADNTTNIERYLHIKPAVPEPLKTLTRSVFYQNHNRFQSLRPSRPPPSMSTPTDHPDNQNNQRSATSLIFQPHLLESSGMLGDIDLAVNNMTGAQLSEYLLSYCSQNDIPCKIQTISSDCLVSRHLSTARGYLFDGIDVDLVNLRTETYTANHRVPTMGFGSPKDDACRRDFTVNALFYNISTGQIEDWNGGAGLDDLKSGRLRTPLDPTTIFLDDPLRILRTVRFATRFGFIPSFDLFRAAHQRESKDGLLYKVSRERIGKEIAGSFVTSGLKRTDHGSLVFLVQLLDSLGALPSVFPLNFVENARKESVKRQLGLSSRQLRREHGVLRRVTDIFHLNEHSDKGHQSLGDCHQVVDIELKDQQNIQPKHSLSKNLPTQSEIVNFALDDLSPTWSPQMTQILLNLVTSFEFAIVSLENLFTSSQNQFFSTPPTTTPPFTSTHPSPRTTPAFFPHGIDIYTTFQLKLKALRIERDSLEAAFQSDLQQLDSDVKNGKAGKDDLKVREKVLKQHNRKMGKYDDRLTQLSSQLDSLNQLFVSTPPSTSQNGEVDQNTTNLHQLQSTLTVLSHLGNISREHLFYISVLFSLHPNSFLFPFQSFHPVLQGGFALSRDQLAYTDTFSSPPSTSTQSHQKPHKNKAFNDESEKSYRSSTVGSSHLQDTAYCPVKLDPTGIELQNSLAANQSIGGKSSIEAGGINTVNDSTFKSILTQRSFPPMAYYNINRTFDKKGLYDYLVTYYNHKLQNEDTSASPHIPNSPTHSTSAVNLHDASSHHLESSKSISFEHSKPPSSSPHPSPSTNTNPWDFITTHNIEHELVNYDSNIYQHIIPTKLSELNHAFRYNALLSNTVQPRWYTPQIGKPLPPQAQHNQSDQLIKASSPPSSQLIQRQVAAADAQKPLYRPNTVPFLWIDSRHDLSKHYFKQNVQLDITYQLYDFIEEFLRQREEHNRGQNQGDDSPVITNKRPIPVHIYIKPSNQIHPLSLSNHNINSTTDTGENQQNGPPTQGNVFFDPEEAEFNTGTEHTSVFDSFFTPMSTTTPPPTSTDPKITLGHASTLSDVFHPIPISTQPLAANSIPRDHTLTPSQILTNDTYRTQQRLNRYGVYWKQARSTPHAIVWGTKPIIPLNTQTIKLQRLSKLVGVAIYEMQARSARADEQGNEDSPLPTPSSPILLPRKQLLSKKHQKLFKSLLKQYSPMIRRRAAKAHPGLTEAVVSNSSTTQTGNSKPILCPCVACSVRYNTWHKLPDGKKEWVDKPPIIWTKDLPTKRKKALQLQQQQPQSNQNGILADPTQDSHAALQDLEEDDHCLVMDEFLTQIDITILDQNGNIVYDSQNISNRVQLYQQQEQEDNIDAMNYSIFNGEQYGRKPLSLKQIAKLAGHFVYHSQRFHHAKLNDGGLAVHYLRNGYIREDKQQELVAQLASQKAHAGDDGFTADKHQDSVSALSEKIDDPSADPHLDEETGKPKKIKLPPKKNRNAAKGNGSQGDDEIAHRYPMIPASDQSWSLPRLGVRFDYDLDFIPRINITQPSYADQLLDVLQDEEFELETSKIRDIAGVNTTLSQHHHAQSKSTPLPTLSLRQPDDFTDTQPAIATQSPSTPTKGVSLPPPTPSIHQQRLNSTLSQLAKSNESPLQPIFTLHNALWIAQHHPHSLPCLLKSNFSQFLTITSQGRHCVLQDDVRGLLYEGLRRDSATVDHVLSGIRVGHSLATLALDSYYLKRVYQQIQINNRASNNISSGDNQQHELTDILSDSRHDILPLPLPRIAHVNKNGDETNSRLQEQQDINSELFALDNSINPSSTLDVAISNILHLRQHLLSTNHQAEQSVSPISPPEKLNLPFTTKNAAALLKTRIDTMLFNDQYVLDPASNQYQPRFNSLLTFEKLHAAFSLPHEQTSDQPHDPLFNQPTSLFPFSPALMAVSALIHTNKEPFSTSVLVASTLLSHWKTNTSQSSAKHMYQTSHQMQSIYSRLDSQMIDFDSNQGFALLNDGESTDKTQLSSVPNSTSRKRSTNSSYNLMYDFFPKPAFQQQLFYPTIYTETNSEHTLSDLAFEKWNSNNQTSDNFFSINNPHHNQTTSQQHAKLLTKRPWDATTVMSPDFSTLDSSHEHHITSRYLQPILLTFEQLGLFNLTTSQSLELDGQTLKDYVDSFLVSDMKDLCDGLSIDTDVWNDDYVPSQHLDPGAGKRKKSVQQTNPGQSQFVDLRQRWARDWSCICGGVLDVATVLSAVLPDLHRDQITCIIKYLLFMTQYQSLSTELQCTTTDLMNTESE